MSFCSCGVFFRLQNATPVTYSEAVLAKKDELLEDVELNLRASEVYTEEHEKLLGNTEKNWTLFVDGYGSDGKRIYDCVKGKTCHQCRYGRLSYFICIISAQRKLIFVYDDITL